MTGNSRGKNVTNHSTKFFTVSNHCDDLTLIVCLFFFSFQIGFEIPILFIKNGVFITNFYVFIVFSFQIFLTRNIRFRRSIEVHRIAVVKHDLSNRQFSMN